MLFGARYDRLVSNTQNTNLANGFTLIDGASNNRLDGNVASANASIGYDVVASNGNRFTKNTGNANAVGFRVILGSSANVVEGNTARGNKQVDAVDDLTGT